MFRFFYTKEWLLWSIIGSALIIGAMWYVVQQDVAINIWFGSFYDMLGKALSETGTQSVTEEEFYAPLWDFAFIVAPLVIVSIANKFFVSHWIFRWRTSMSQYYQDNYKYANTLDGSSQRVQDDSLKFSRYMQGLGVDLINSIMVLVAFTPILWELSKKVTEIPYFGTVDNSLVIIAIIMALGGTVLLMIVGFKLPGIEYNIQKYEARYRKVLVLGEDDINMATPPMLSDAFSQVRKIHYTEYFHYAYFGLVRLSYLQGMVLVPYIALGPTIIAGVITLGTVQQIVRAFGKVENSLQYLVHSWSLIVELMSVVKRLREFERELEANKKAAGYT
jgi:peptide/bleomycin uptake transporter